MTTPRTLLLDEDARTLLRQALKRYDWDKDWPELESVLAAIQVPPDTPLRTLRYNVLPRVHPYYLPAVGY